MSVYKIIKRELINRVFEVKADSEGDAFYKVECYDECAIGIRELTDQGSYDFELINTNH